MMLASQSTDSTSGMSQPRIVQMAFVVVAGEALGGAFVVTEAMVRPEPVVVAAEV